VGTSDPPAPHNNPIPDWVPDAIFYQIFPDRFCRGNPYKPLPNMASWDDMPTRENFFGGNLQGIRDRLDYLQYELGINAIYLNPIFRAETNHRYDTSDYFQVDPALGTNESFRDLVKEIHRRGMHIILDGVFNHCGKMFEPFQDVVRNGEKSVYTDWFLARSYPLRTDPLNYLTCGGATYLPKLNHAHRPVRDFILKVASFWTREFGIDGWRLDVPFKVPMDFWREFRQVVRRANPKAYLVGEIWREAGPWIAGDLFDGATNYRLRELLLDYGLTGILDAEDFAFETDMLSQAHGDSFQAMFNLLGSHDTARILTLLNGDIACLKIVLTYLMTIPGVPMIYYGDEIGLLGKTDPDCRRPMPWEKDRWSAPVNKLYRQLINLRKAYPCLRRGKREILFFFNGVFVYRMCLERDEVIVALNPRESVPELIFAVPGRSSEWKDVESGRSYSVKDGKINLGCMPPCSALVLVRSEEE
jgi:glycosidase